jgi:hypothetical protein
MNPSKIRYSASLKHFILFFALIAGVSCQKEKSTEHGGPGGGGVVGGSAAFTLVPSGSNCSDAVVTGNFEVGTQIGTNATLTVTVNVTKTGDWTYTTAQVNGILFAGFGDFTATGNQQITLFAVGEPTKAGVSSFNLNFGASSCAFSVTVAPAGQGGGNAEIYYKATIDGVNYYQEVTDNNGFEAGSGMGGVDEVTFGGSLYYATQPQPAGLTAMGAEKGIMKNYLAATEAQFRAFFAPGDYPYAPEDFSDGDGIQIGWLDPSGEDWWTRNGPTDQVGSTLKIISATDARDITGTLYLKVKMQFNCKLYNVNTGAVKTLTNGELVVYFGML